MRLTEFRALMREQFGPHRAASVADDHVFSALGGRTVNQAITAGENVKEIWLAVCDSFDVPPAMRHGLPD